MPEAFKNRLVLLPMLLLAVFLGLFVAVEYRKHEGDVAIRKILGSPFLGQAEKILDSIAALASEVDFYHAEGNKTKETIQRIYRLLDETLREEEDLLRLFAARETSGEESLAAVDMLREVRKKTERIEKSFSGEAALSGNSWPVLRGELDELTEKARRLSAFLRSLHAAEAQSLLEKISDYERRRGILSAFVLLGGLILILSLLDNMCRYRRSAERALDAERSNAVFAAALQSTRVGVLIRDMRDKKNPVVFVNEAFTRMTGYTLEEIGEQPPDCLFGWKTEPATVSAFRRAVALQETATFDLLVYRKEGAPFWSEWHLSPLLDGEGRLTHFVSLFTDMTTVRETQEALEQAKRLAQNASAIKTSFLAMMSHEIRTPINGILGVLKLVEETRLDEEQKHLIGIARTSSNALHGIINDILDYAKMEAGKIEIFEETFSLRTLLDGCIGLFQTVAAEKGIAIELDLRGDPPEWLTSDEGRIRQVLLNLLSNATKFTEKGFVRLSVQSLMEQEVKGHRGVLLRFEVQDTGLGISPEDQEKLFKEFSQVERSFTRRFGGTGLGLAISRRLVEMLGGEIGVESLPGKGSRFWFMVPLKIAEHNAPSCEIPIEKEKEERPDHGRVCHVLLAEDNDTNRLVARRYLEKAGVLVEEAVNGVEAVEKARAATFDLVLMDVSMPEMDGLLATCHIRSLGGDNGKIPIIALTAHAMTGDRELCLAAGMNDYLNKPLEYETLVKMISRWIKLPETPAPAPIEASLRTFAPDISTFPDLDPRVLARMREDLGDKAVEEVARTFLKDSANRMTFFEKGEKNLEAILNVAHTLKSCSGNCGLVRFSRLMESLELAASRKEKEKAEELLPFVVGTYLAARAKLEEELAKYTS